MTTCHHTIDSPIGPLTLVAADGELREVRFPNAPPVDDRAGPDDPDDPVLVDAARQLGEYFAGTRLEFDLPLGPRARRSSSTPGGAWRRSRTARP